VTGLDLTYRVDRLDKLAKNLWWNWHTEVQKVFCTLDYQLGKLSGHNPISELRQIGSDKLQTTATDLPFLNLCEPVRTSFDREISASDTAFALDYPDLVHSPVAYFHMECALHNSLTVYADGLVVP
jgi:glucan phosphorylase